MVAVYFFYLALFSTTFAIPEENFYPFGDSAGDVALPRILDVSSPAIPLSITTFPYFGQYHNQLFVNSNGHITFFEASPTFVPQQFPLANSLQLIAPFWADSDTRNNQSGLVWYRVTTDRVSRERVQSEVRRAFPNEQDFNPAWLLIATWDHVGVYPELAHVTNTFQCVLATDGLRSHVIFLYADDGIEWLWSVDHEGIPGQVGFNAGDGIRFFSHPDSFTTNLFNIPTTSNSEVPGVWIFRVDGEEVVPAGCSNQVKLTFTPRFGHLLGGTPVIVSGPCFLPDDKVTCTFEGVQTPVDGVYVSEDQILCVTPVMKNVGEIKVVVEIKSTNDSIKALDTEFFAVSPDRSHAVDLDLLESSLFLDLFSEFSIQWDTIDIVPSYFPNITVGLSVDVALYVQQYIQISDGKWDVDWVLGSFDEPYIVTAMPINMAQINDLKLPKLDMDYCTIPLHEKTRFLKAKLCPVAIKVSLSKTDNTKEIAEIGAWSGVAFMEIDSNHSATCQEWIDAETSSDVGGDKLAETVIPCPPNMFLAENDRDYQKEDMNSIYRETKYRKQFMGLFHPNIAECYRQSTPIDGSGQQCCYESDGGLVKGEPSGGSADIMSAITDYNRHISDDIIPYLYCCHSEPGSSRCNEYFQWRPSGEEMGYLLPIPACIYGDPHIVTLDGLKYTFNGRGEFVMIESNDIFTLQGRMDTILASDGTPTPGTVFTALVARQHQTNTTVQFDLRPTGVRVRHNGLVVSFGDLDEIKTTYVTLFDDGNNTVSAFFSEGAKIEIKVENGIISVMLITLPSSLKEKTRGLMGNFNGDSSDDLVPQAETKPISPTSSLEEIHNMFGITWILKSVDESLFTYNPGESFFSFYSPSFTPMFEPTFTNSTLEALAREVCKDDENCLFDIAATKTIEIGMATMNGGNDFDEIVQMAVPVVCDPPCVKGACIQNDTCSCNEGYLGDTCDTIVTSECDLNLCENNGTCTKHVLTYTCECPRGFTGAFCQEKEPPFHIQLVNSSPIVSENSVSVTFVVNRKIGSIRCSLTARRQPQRQINCRTGYVIFNDLSADSYVFRIQAQSISGEKATVRRIVHVGEQDDDDFCAVHLVNEGMIIEGTSASFFFRGTDAVDSYRCRLRSSSRNTGFTSCQSLVRYHGLEKGEYQFQVVPIGCNNGKRLSSRFTIF